MKTNDLMQGQVPRAPNVKHVFLVILFAANAAVSLTGCVWADGGHRGRDYDRDRDHMHDYDSDRDHDHGDYRR